MSLALLEARSLESKLDISVVGIISSISRDYYPDPSFEISGRHARFQINVVINGRYQKSCIIVGLEMLSKAERMRRLSDGDSVVVNGSYDDSRNLLVAKSLAVRARKPVFRFSRELVGENVVLTARLA